MKISWNEIILKVSDKNPKLREEAAELLSSVRSNKTITILQKLLKDENYNVRRAAINSLSSLHSSDSLPKIINCLKDKDELVRISAVECLGQFKKRVVIKALAHKINDKSALVRSYVGSALGEIGDLSAKRLIRCRLISEKNDLAKAGFYHGLYLLGDKSYLDKMIGLLASSDYRARCSMAHILSYVVNSKNKNKIKKVLNIALDKENIVAARSSMKNSLNELSKY